MSRTICVMGESGSGKTTSCRNLNPEETYYIDCDKKGLSWRGWRDQYCEARKNYYKGSEPEKIHRIIEGVSNKRPEIKYIVVDTINGIMIDDEMARSKEKGYDKWVDLAACIWDLVTDAHMFRDDLWIIFMAHTQIERDDSGYIYTHIRTSGRKLDKIVLESKFTTVLLAKCVDGRYVFETQARNSTAKTPMGCFEQFEIDNDMTQVIAGLQDF